MCPQCKSAYWNTPRKSEGKLVEDGRPARASRDFAATKRTMSYAAKWSAEHQDTPTTKPTDEALAACFAGCVRPAKHDEYDAIREAIPAFIPARFQSPDFSDAGGREITLEDCPSRATPASTVMPGLRDD